MPNTIKYSTTGDTFSLNKGNFFIGVGDVGKGPSTSTQTYNGVSPVASGYTVYIYNPAQASNVSFYSANNDAELITFTNGIAGQTFTGATQCLNWYATQTNYICVNIDYESIVTNGLSLNLDAGFTPSYTSSGTTWYDVSGYANNGTLTNGPTYSSSNGGTIVFDGTDDYVIKSSPSNLSNLEGNFTIESFIKPTSSSYGNIVVLANSSYNLECQFVFTPSKVLVTKYGGSILVTSTDNSVSLNNWYQVIYSQENNVGKIYINGALNATSNVVPQIATTSNILLGTYNNVNSPQPFGGSYGIVRIYNRALSLTEITQNFNAQKFRFGL